MRATLYNKVKLELLNLFPKKAFSMALRRWAALPLPGPVNTLQSQIFCSIASINTGEAERPVDEYGTLDALFTRRLKEGARLVSGDPERIISPSDGRLESTGFISGERLIQAKGLDYTVGELLGDEERAAPFKDGGFITIYLSPHDYHRVHFPVSGEVVGWRHIPGAFFPVGNFSRTNVPRLYARNERVVTYIKTSRGMVAVVMVAAMGVGNMTLSFLPEPGAPEGTLPCSKGDELGIFHLGSTVVMLFEEGIMLPEKIEQGSAVTMGSPIARFI